MSNTIVLDTEVRDGSLNPRQLRAEGKLPATIYGKGMDSVSVAVDKHAFTLAYRDNKDAKFDLKTAKKTYKAKVQNLQMNYSLNEEIHVEFLAV